MIREGWPILSAILIIAGLALQNAAVGILGFAIAIACGGAMLWARYALRRLTYERIVPEDHAFAGEQLAATLRLTNGKPLPLPWIETDELLPEGLVRSSTFDPESEYQLRGQVGTLGLHWRTSIGSYERVNRDLELRCPERGVYEIGPTQIRSGDAFGLFDDTRSEDRRTRIVVYPRTVELGDLALPSRRPYGESRGALRVFEDPSRVAGIRDYRPGDSMRRIDWNATARLGSLQSRVYDPSAAQHLLVCLNTQTVMPAWSGYIPAMLERGITIAASIARDAYDTRYSVGLIANSTMPETNRSWQEAAADALQQATYEKEIRERTTAARRHGGERAIRIPPGRRPEQFIRLLEALAVITPFVLEPLSAMLDREEHRLTAGTTLAVVTGIMPDDLAATLLRLRRRGHQLTVLSTSGDLWSDQLLGVDVRDLSQIAMPTADAIDAPDFRPPPTQPAQAAP